MKRFILYVFLNFVLVEILRIALKIEQLTYLKLNESFSLNQIEKGINLQKKYWLSFIVPILFFFVKQRLLPMYFIQAHFSTAKQK